MQVQGKGYAFIGDCIPVKGDIPIYIDNHAAIDTINKIKNMVGIDVFYPAWDTVYSADEIDKKAAEGLEIIEMIEQAVQRVKTNNPDKKLSGLVCEVCRELEMPWLAANPLFARTVQSHLKQ